MSPPPTFSMPRKRKVSSTCENRWRTTKGCGLTASVWPSAAPRQARSTSRHSGDEERVKHLMTTGTEESSAFPAARKTDEKSPELISP